MTLTQPIPVLLDRYATVGECDAVRAVIDRAGGHAMVRAVWEKEPQTGNGAFWMTLFLLGVPFAKFCDGFFTKLGENAADTLRDFVRELREARRASTHASVGWVEFDDVEDTKIMIPSDIPDDAFNALLEIDWSRVQGGTLSALE